MPQPDTFPGGPCRKRMPGFEKELEMGMKQKKSIRGMLAGIGIADWILFAAVALFCFFCFQQRDLLHTAGCSVGYLNGHFADFYDYCGSFDIHPSYMPTVYVLFALWNLPMKLFGILKTPTEDIALAAILWSKALPCLVYLVSGIVICRICLVLSMGQKKARLCAFACLTMPIAFYDQFIFGQYDIFMTICVLMGLLSYLKKKDIGFIAWFALAVTFKYTALVIFLPLLLLREKRVFRILAACVLLLLPLALEFLLYRGSAGFSNYVFGIGSSGDTPTGYIFSAGIFTGFQLSARYLSVSLVVLIYGCILGWAYFTRPEGEREEAGWAFYLSCLSFFVLFGLAKWHPQWLLFAVPFWVISAFMNRETKIFMVIDLLFMLFFVMFLVETIPNNVDQAMINHGVLSGLVGGDIGMKRIMSDYIGFLPDELCLSLISMIMLVYALFKHPRYLAAEPDAEVNCVGWLRARFLLGVGFFVIPAWLCLRAAMSPPYAGYQVAMEAADGAWVLDEVGDGISERFLARGDVLDLLQFRVYVNGRINDGYIKLTLKDEEGAVLYEEDWETDGLVDGSIINARIGGLPVRKNSLYEALFEITQANGDFRLSIPTQSLKENTSECAMSGREKMNFRLAMTVYER